MPTGSADREGLTICDATSAAFAQDLDWDKLDVVTFSWQKVLGGEAAHGMLILAPRRRTAGELHAGLADAEDLPHDQGRQAHRRHLRGRDHQHPLDALRRGRGRRAEMGERSAARRPDRPRRCQLQGARRLGGQDAWVDFLAEDPATALQHLGLPEGRRSGGRRARRRRRQAAFAKAIASRLEKEGVAYDIGAYRDAPPGLRIWCGATVETADDLEALTPWLDWAFAPKGRAGEGGLT
jgi:phosphoserine aminotransferase